VDDVELLHAQAGDDLQQVRPSGFVASGIQIPCGDGNLKLGGQHAEKWLMGLFPLAYRPSGESEIGHLHGDPQPVVVPSMLADKGRVLPAQRVTANQLHLLAREGKKFQSLCGGQQLAARHR
jgi:hypothetical protein